MSRWFRYYDGALDDPKVQSLPADMFKMWVNLLCIASRHDGKLPVSDLPFMLRTDEKRVAVALKELTSRGLIDDDGNGPEPHNWSGRQHKSDVSNERVKRHRERSRNGDGNVTATVTVTPPDTDTDTDTEERQKEGGANAPTDLAFLGRIIRLKPGDYRRWQKSYHAIPDLPAELTKADDYYSENPPGGGKWFFPVSKWLERAHRAALKAKSEADPWRGVDCRPATEEERANWKALGLS